jgi:hypothetical protein
MDQGDSFFEEPPFSFSAPSGIVYNVPLVEKGGTKHVP